MKRLIICVLLMGACESHYSNSYVLDGPRVLAIRTEPVDILPDGNTTIDSLVYLPKGQSATYEWSWCPSLASDFSCALTESTLTSLLDPDGTGGVTTNYSLGSGASFTLTAPASSDLIKTACQKARSGRTGDGGLDGGTDDAGTDDAGTDGAGTDDGSVTDAGTTDDSGADGGGTPTIVCTNDAWQIDVLLTVKVGSRTLRAYRTVNLYYSTPSTTNTNPTINALSFGVVASSDVRSADGGLDGGSPIDTTGAEDADAGVVANSDCGVSLFANIPASATDTYVGTLPRTNDGGTDDGGGDDAAADASAVADDAGSNSSDLSMSVSDMAMQHGGMALDGGMIGMMTDGGVQSSEDGGAEGEGGMTGNGTPIGPGMTQIYESLTLSWYVVSGELSAASTSLAAAAVDSSRDFAPLEDNRWVPPSEPGTYDVILVVRDDRGGVGWLRSTATVGKKR